MGSTSRSPACLCRTAETGRQEQLTATSRGWQWGPWTVMSPRSWNGRRWDREQVEPAAARLLATEVVPLAEQLAELGIDPTPLFATTSGILRLYADTLERPDHR